MDQSTGDRFIRAVGQKGLGHGEEMNGFLNDMNGGAKKLGIPWWRPWAAHLQKRWREHDRGSQGCCREKVWRQSHYGQDPQKGIPEQWASRSGWPNMRECVKAFRDALENKIKTNITGEGANVLLTIRWVAMLVSRYLMGKDGSIANERHRGRRCRIPEASLGE